MLSYPNPQQMAAAEMMQRAVYAASQNHRMPQPQQQPQKQLQQSQQQDKDGEDAPKTRSHEDALKGPTKTNEVSSDKSV